MVGDRVGTRLLFENERVRIWEIELEPGEELPLHRHRHMYFYVCNAGGRLRVRGPDGSVGEYDERTGDTHFHEIDGEVVHALANVGTTTVRYTTVELLS